MAKNFLSKIHHFIFLQTPKISKNAKVTGFLSFSKFLKILQIPQIPHIKCDISLKRTFHTQFIVTYHQGCIFCPETL